MPWGQRLELVNLLITQVLLWPTETDKTDPPLRDTLLPGVLQHPQLNTTLSLTNVTLVTRCDMLAQYIAYYGTSRGGGSDVGGGGSSEGEESATSVEVASVGGGGGSGGRSGCYAGVSLICSSDGSDEVCGVGVMNQKTVGVLC